MLQRSFKPAKCKTSLKMAVSRIKLLKNKRDSQVKHLKRELAQLLESGQDQTARIRVEHVLREEKTMAAYELVEIYCELIAARLPIIESQKNCPIDLKEAIASIIFASPRCADIPELMDIRKHLTAKYGKEFVNAALELRPDCGVGRLLIEKLSAKAPDGPTKIKILTSIAEEHNVKWEPKSFEERELKPPEDLLNGPNSFEKSSKDYVDHPNRQSSSSHDGRLQTYDEQGPPRGQVPHRPMEKTNMPENFYSQATRTPSYSPNFDHPNVRDEKYGLSEAHLPAGGMQHAHTYSMGSSSSSFPSRSNWNMEFKDATAAAQAAAESAERASMAARAAAELSSRGSATMQYSAESHEPSTYVKKNNSRSTLRNQPVSGETAGHLRPENITRQYSGESHKPSTDIRRDEPRKNASSTMSSHLAGESENLSYDQRNSGTSHGQVGSYAQDDHSDDDEDLSSIGYKSSSLAEIKPVSSSFTARQSFGNLQTEDAYSPQHISETSGDLGHTSTGRKDYDKFEVPNTREPPDTRNVDYDEFDDQERLRHDVSYSHTDAYTDDVNISNVSQHPGQSYDEDAFVVGDRENIQRYTSETKSYGNASAVFDDYGFNDDEKIIDWEDHHAKQDYGHIDTPSFETLSTAFRDVNSQARQDMDSARASEGESNVFNKQKYAHFLSRSSTRSGQDSHADELPVTFDDSDGHDSGSEEEASRSKLVTVDDGAVIRNQRAASQVTADFPSVESAEVHQDDVSLEAPTFESNSELKFGTLTGGLRNKGYRLPPYSKVLADREPAEEKSTKMEHGFESSVSAKSQPKKVYDRKENRGAEYNLSSHQGDSEDELQTHTSTSSLELDSRRAGIKENNKAGKEVSVPFTDLMEDYQEEPLGDNTRPNVRLSRRTKPSPTYPRQTKATTANVSPDRYVSTPDRAIGGIYMSSSHDVEALGKRQIQGNRTEIRSSLQETEVSTNPSFKPASESKRSSVNETFRSFERKPSQEMSSNQSSSFVQPLIPEQGTKKTKDDGFQGTPGSSAKMVSSMSDDQSSKGSSSVGSSRAQPSHVHPKLPDYETLAARLQSLRQNR